MPAMAPPRKRQDSNAPAITDAELAVLKSFWDHGPATVRELIARLGTDSAYTTVQTLVTRLVEKGRGLAHVFTATTAREELAHRRVEEVASSLLDGATAPLVLRLVENGKFSADDIKSFRKLLKAAEQKARGDKS